EVLDALRVPVAICTNKPRGPTEGVLAALGVRERFASVVAGGDTPELKPHPAPLRRVAAELGFPTTSLVMVGDGPQDSACGKAAGAFTIGVLGGFGTEPILRATRPDVVLRGMAELPGALAAASEPSGDERVVGG